MKLEITYEELMELSALVKSELKCVSSLVSECSSLDDDLKVLEGLKVKLNQLLDNI